MSKRVALVTGGMGGIGQAICQELANNGFRVVAGYNRSHEAAHQWQDQQKKTGYTFEIAHADVADYHACETMMKKIKTDIGNVDILVNNAGIIHDATACRMKKEDWDNVISVDLNSVFYVTRTVINDMKNRNFGRIINISSINGQKGQYGQANYSAAKAGMHGFTMALAQELAKDNITVNTISPGYVATEMVLHVPEPIRDKILSEIPLGRFAEPEEIARLVAFLAADENGYITGANIAINGGQYMS